MSFYSLGHQNRNFQLQNKVHRKGRTPVTHKPGLQQQPSHTHFHRHKHRGVKKQPQAALLYSSIHIFAGVCLCVCLFLFHTLSQCSYPSFSLIILHRFLPLYLCPSQCVFFFLSQGGYWLPIINSFSLTGCHHRYPDPGEEKGGGGWKRRK